MRRGEPSDVAFVPNAELANATRDVVTALVQRKKAAGTLTKPQEKELALVIEKTRLRRRRRAATNRSHGSSSSNKSTRVSG